LRQNCTEGTFFFHENFPCFSSLYNARKAGNSDMNEDDISVNTFYCSLPNLNEFLYHIILFRPDSFAPFCISFMLCCGFWDTWLCTSTQTYKYKPKQQSP